MSEMSYFSLCLQYFDLVWLVCVSFIYVPVIDIEALPGLCHDSVGIVTFVSTDTVWIQLPLQYTAGLACPFITCL